MKKLLLNFVLAVAFFSCGTSDTETTQTQTPIRNSHTLVFFDKTQSVNVDDSFVRNKFQSALKSLIDKNIQTEGDVFEIYYIHENTAKAKVVSVSARTVKENTEGLNATDLEAAQTNYEMSIGKERKMILDMAVQKMLEKNPGASNAETNISASIPLLSNALNTKKDVKAYYFSDMVESLKNGRDFHKAAPISHDQAEDWAKKDAENYKLYNLTNAQVSIILPFAPTSSSKENNPNVTDYWKVYFEALGVNGVTEI
ncbi:hypothetical protein EGI22_01815 [Lacihabitans sp. LS3-19]|uniref:hypothetical protein n=1 Tax=Lacihabitans sp. LS3-19 TaxID=2487335 RepID=UPI0020CF106F|nr:hypothetical protein [Lacihabitans sp. LS3-19]MCP9766626.1 hypothetical protein [Lacihabitans sp. LS3-19]